MFPALNTLVNANRLMSEIMNDLSNEIPKISDETLSKQLPKIRQIGLDVFNSYEQWNQSMEDGMFSTLGKEVDMKLLITNHLDVKQLKVTMFRMSAANLSLRELDCLQTHACDFLTQSKNAKAEECVEQAEQLIELIRRGKGRSRKRHRIVKASKR